MIVQNQKPEKRSVVALSLLRKIIILLFLCSVCGGIIIGLPTNALAGNKLDLEAGYFALSGKTASSSGSLSGFGSYRFGYRRSFHPKLDLGIGYNLSYSSIFSGDSTSGIDIGVTYFPFTLSGRTVFESNGQKLELQPNFRPFVRASFNQRSIQSTQTGYSGFGITGGAEKQWTEKTSYLFSIRYMSLGGTRGATATIIDILFGIGWGF